MFLSQWIKVPALTGCLLALACDDGSGTPPGQDVGYTSDEILRACTLIGSCIPDDGVNDCLRDLYSMGEGFLGVIKCLAKASGCSGVKSCTGFWSSTGSPCGPGVQKSFCASANAVVYCDDSLGINMDCNQLFKVGCKTSSSGVSYCGGASCSGSDTCKGDYKVRCNSGMEVYDEPCALWGLTCKAAKCIGPQEACAQSTCQGGTAVFCIRGNALRLSCAALGSGFSCKTTSTGVVCQQGTACDPSTSKWKESCEGDKLVVCNAGQVAKVDCKALGFSGCGTHGCQP